MKKIRLDPDQQAVLDDILAWQESSQGIFQVHGRAGTGKSTMIRELAKALNPPVLAPTNKAAAVLRNKGILANTLHSYLYIPQPAGTPAQVEEAKQRLDACKRGTDDYTRALAELRQLRRLAWVLKSREDDDPELVIVDESSMIGSSVGSDLANVAPQIVAFGDPWQLPPVKERPFFRPPANAVLERQHRQGAGSGILRMAEGAYRQNRPLTTVDDDARALRGDRMTVDDYLLNLMRCDQVLVGTHATRRKLNHLLREMQGRQPVPQQGDTLTCVRSPNFDERDLGLINGFQYDVLSTTEKGGFAYLELQDVFNDEIIGIGLDVQQFLRATLPFDQGGELEGDPRNPALDFDGALTTHKSQGSQFPNVVVQNESYVFRTSARRWLYTAMTRAQKKLTVITNTPKLPKLERRYLRAA